jgi:isochorismate synthase/2-succinyl-5-enolpyruvyl-6-hydroxy-3-cyclohexene-1-carboxylate synthase/2-succinyl-6-hydroxy-2,4-cyclohexadiene-1-carboxylate synthase/O-succinylbenzoate synthase
MQYPGTKGCIEEFRTTVYPIVHAYTLLGISENELSCLNVSSTVARSAFSSPSLIRSSDMSASSRIRLGCGQGRELSVSASRQYRLALYRSANRCQNGHRRAEVPVQCVRDGDTERGAIAACGGVAGEGAEGTSGGQGVPEFAEVRTLSLESSYEMALAKLIKELDGLCAHDLSAKSVRTRGCIRIEVPLCRGVTALQWLKSQSPSLQAVYFSSKISSAPDTPGSLSAESSFREVSSMAGIGYAWMWKGHHGRALDEQTMDEIANFTDIGGEGCECAIKVLGGSRFDPGGNVDSEWEPFGSFCLLIPRVEFAELNNGCVLACTIAWDSNNDRSESGAAKVYGYDSMQEAVRDALRCISDLQGVRETNCPGVVATNSNDIMQSLEHVPDSGDWDQLMEMVQGELQGVDGSNHDSSFVDNYSVQPTTALDEYLRNGQKGLDDLLAASQTTGPKRHRLSPPDRLAKLVLARKTSLMLHERLDCCTLLESIQEKDPKAYQFMLRLGGGQAFLGCTPERLYCRTNRQVVSEAVAGTRGRGPGGDIEKDFWLAFDLLQSQKDGLEFQLVRESIVDTFEKLCDDVDVEVNKSILKQGSVQHLYGRIAGSLNPDVQDLDLVRELHPTPAVCGQPDEDAMCLLRSFEPFDRGFYAGPFGWFSKHAADVAVAIRSSLVRSNVVDLYAGVGIVPGSTNDSEWNELDLKIGQFLNLLRNSTRERILSSQNPSILAAQVMIEELCRLGCNTFCIAPGSRSSPLTLAAAQHPRARVIPGIDERSLGFWALGHSKATGKPCVVITSSGTAVANLLPAVVEASQSDVPLLLLTADRPAEMRDTGSNQTIDQVGIFGSYVRWEADLIAPSFEVPIRSTLAAVSNAVRIATSSSCSGPVHLNCQFREPLDPTNVEWKGTNMLQGLDAWLLGRQPFTASPGLTQNHSSIDTEVMGQILTCSRGLIVIGELAHPDDVSAALQVARYLGWPVAGDVLSGTRIGRTFDESIMLINHMDHILLDNRLWEGIKPDTILHLGTRLTSKRLLSFLDWSTKGQDPARWILASRKKTRYDPSNALDVRLDCSILELLLALKSSGLRLQNNKDYARTLEKLESIVSDAISTCMEGNGLLTEALVAKVISHCIPSGDGLFVGNSMPIRDLDMFGGLRTEKNHLIRMIGAPIAANRGASGIDGVLSSAAGFADGLQRKCTLVVGDVSFIHDTNGLNLLRTGGMSPALTVVLINNSGGGIFNFLPIAQGVPDEQFRPLWTTPQYVDIAGLCRAQGIPHMRVTCLSDLEHSLKSSWALNRHCILEVVTDIESNVSHHEDIKKAVMEALNENYTMPGTKYLDSMGKIERVRVNRVSIPLKQSLTTTAGKSFVDRDVALIMMDAILSDGEVRQVIGEIAPLPGLHIEDIDAAVNQAEILGDLICGSSWCGDSSMPLESRISGLKGALDQIGITSLYPSVTCGFEAALLQLTWGKLSVEETRNACPVSALLDPHGKSPEIIIEEANAIIRKGYNCIKVKAGRAIDPALDVEYLQIIRSAVGKDVLLRVDANQAWTLEQALSYGKDAENLSIEYLEEPLDDPRALSFWPKDSRIPLALDESIDQGVFDPLDKSKDIPTPVKFIVLKPSLLGGISRTLKLSRAAAARGVVPIISSSFESPVGLIHLSQIASCVAKDDAHCHGISTESWFYGGFPNLTFTQSSTGSDLSKRFMPAGMRLYYEEMPSLLTCETNRYLVSSSPIMSRFVEWNVKQVYPNIHGSLRNSREPPIVLLHGMFGSALEMGDLSRALHDLFPEKAILCVDLPGHGLSRWTKRGLEASAESQDMIDLLSEAVKDLLDNAVGPCYLVGYSLGARVALATLLRQKCTQILRLFSLSGGLGISDQSDRRRRASRDDALAEDFRILPRKEFFQKWYNTSLWDSMRNLPGFSMYLESKARQQAGKIDSEILAATLRGCSPGRVACLTETIGLSNESENLVMVYGDQDTKYMGLASALGATLEDRGAKCRPHVATVRGAGHAMHLEAPAAVAELIYSILKQ